MALTEAELKLIEEGVALAVSAVLAAVRASSSQGPIDWSSLRITETPEMALAKAKKSGEVLANFSSASKSPEKQILPPVGRQDDVILK